MKESLISMLNNFNYENNEVDLMLYSNTGDFMPFLIDKVNLLNENRRYSTFRKTVAQILKEISCFLGIKRILSKLVAKIKGRLNNIYEAKAVTVGEEKILSKPYYN